MIPVSSSLQPSAEQLARFLKETGRPTLEIAGSGAKALPTFEVGEEVTAKIVDTFGSNRFTVLVKDKLMTLTLDRRHAFAGEPGGNIKLVVASIEPKLSFAMDAKAPMHMPDSSSKVLLSPATRYLSTLLFVASAGGEADEVSNLPQFYGKPGTGIATATSLLSDLANAAKSLAPAAGKPNAGPETAQLPTALLKTPVDADGEAHPASRPAAGAAAQAASPQTAQASKAAASVAAQPGAAQAAAASAARFPASLASLFGVEKSNPGQAAAAVLTPLFENMEQLPTTGMAQLLKQAVTRSGVFYESHLADWAQSGRSLHALRQEPQAALKLPEKLAELAKPNALDNPSIQDAVKTGSATGLRERELAFLRNDNNASQLGQLVHKQLDALDQNQFSWQGIAWPGQAMDWRIEREAVDQRDARGGQAEEEVRWSTSLTMELPNLGGLAAKIALSPAGLMVRFHTDSADTAEAIETHQGQLRENLLKAGLSLLTFAVQKGDEHEHAQ